MKADVGHLYVSTLSSRGLSEISQEVTSALRTTRTVRLLSLRRVRRSGMENYSEEVSKLGGELVHAKLT